MKTSKKKNAVKPKSNHYVDNVLFLEEMIEFRNSVIKSKENNGERPKVPDYVGECFLKIAEHLSYKPNFINYTFREEMISDGIENCLQYIDNFDPEKSRNPFAYFTQIIYYAFLRRIQKEKKQLYVKYKSLERAGIMEDIMVQQSPGGGDEYRLGKYNDNIYSNLYDFIEEFETKHNINKKKKKKKKNSAKKQKVKI